MRDIPNNETSNSEGCRDGMLDIAPSNIPLADIPLNKILVELGGTMSLCGDHTKNIRELAFQAFVSTALILFEIASIAHLYHATPTYKQTS
jgi:hypothetical protein